jgi:hypothetical protein
MPEVALYPVPVVPQAVRTLPDWGTWWLLVGEYNKLLAVMMGLPGLVIAGEPRPDDHASDAPPARELNRIAINWRRTSGSCIGAMPDSLVRPSARRSVSSRRPEPV